MRETTPEFCWSFSRHRRFRECLRQYYLAYYASWKGWDWRANEFARRCFRLAKMKTLDMWAGEVIHETIRWALERFWRTREMVTREAAREYARALLNRGWNESKRRLWEQDPARRVNLLEHYYGIEIPRERQHEIRDRVLQCLENFWTSDVFARIGASDPSTWKALETWGTFRTSGVTVRVKIDFAFEDDGVLLLYDWKSGREGEEDPMQLAGYALYAIRTWQVSPERLRVVPVYLQKGTPPREHLLLPEHLLEAEEMILQSAAQMRARLDDPQRNLARPEQFPMTHETWRCPRCVFQEICYGGRYEDERSGA